LGLGLWSFTFMDIYSVFVYDLFDLLGAIRDFELTGDDWLR